MKLRPSRRDLITGAAALAAYSQMEDAEAVNRLLLLGATNELYGKGLPIQDQNFFNILDQNNLPIIG